MSQPRKNGTVLLKFNWCVDNDWESLLRRGTEMAHVAVVVLEDAADFSNSCANGRRVAVAAAPNAPFVVDWAVLRMHLNDLDRDRGGSPWEPIEGGLVSSQAEGSTLGADEVMAMVQAVLVGNPATRQNLMAAYESALGNSDLDGVTQVLKVAESDPALTCSLQELDARWDASRSP